jgi:hypothetical protein
MKIINSSSAVEKDDKMTLQYLLVEQHVCLSTQYLLDVHDVYLLVVTAQPYFLVIVDDTASVRCEMSTITERAVMYDDRDQAIR